MSFKYIAVLQLQISTLYKPQVFIFYELFKTQGCVFTKIGNILASVAVALNCNPAFLFPLYYGSWGALFLSGEFRALKKMLIIFCLKNCVTEISSNISFVFLPYAFQN